MVVHDFLNTAGRSLFKSNFSFSFYEKTIQPILQNLLAGVIAIIST